MLIGMTNPFADTVEMPEVVGESRYQDMLWLIVGGPKDHYVKHRVTVTLVPEDDNPADANAVAVQVDHPYLTGGGGDATNGVLGFSEPFKANGSSSYNAWIVANNPSQGLSATNSYALCSK